MSTPQLVHEFAIGVYRDAILKAVVSQRKPLEEAATFVKSIMGHGDLVEQAYRELKKKQEENTPTGANSGAIVKPASYQSGWYLGSLDNGHWSRYRELLMTRGEAGLDELHSETERITSLLADPNSPGCRRKGLVMGNVQSGKTRNFAGVIAKAADVGYRYVIVLSGINNNLREQTQARLTKDLFYAEGWYPLTQKDKDFSPVAKPQELIFNQPTLCAVVKKNTTRLDNLVEMMRSIPLEIRRQRPVLIIDDEADQATPNSLAERDKISAINQHLRNLWASVVSGTYVAYTATPFANVLMDPDDAEELFPSDFITTIQPGPGYFGSERVFGIAEAIDQDGVTSSEGLNMVRMIPKDEAALLRPPSDKTAQENFDPDLPESLCAAFDWFVVATAIRRARGDVGHSSMLVHTTHYTLPHFTMQERFRQLIHGARIDVARGELELLRASWSRESQAVASEATLPLPAWEQVAVHLPDVLSNMEVIVDNGSSSDRLNYDDDRLRVVVAIGGGTLSRGLTLEGLAVSYFTRTSNAYDTLMQMGRWFGYRPKYEDLPRVWISDGLDTDYAFLARVEKDLREEISSVEGSEFTPKDVGVRVRAHPGRLEVTAANKMFHADVVQLGLSGTFNQTFLLDGSDPAITDRNVARVDAMVAGIPARRTPGTPQVPMFCGVPGQRVAAFLNEFEVHADQKWLTDNRERLGEWITKWADGPTWNVVLVDTSSAKEDQDGRSTIDLGGVRLRCANRSVLRGSTPDKLDFKAIMSQNDRLRDIDPALYAGERLTTNGQRRRLRRLHGGTKGLVVVYPISGNSTAEPGSDTRIDIPIEHNLLGFAIFFPHVNDADGKAGAFVSVKPMWEVPDTVEGDDVGIEEVL